MPNLAVMTNSALMVLHIRSDSGERIWDRIIFLEVRGELASAVRACACAVGLAGVAPIIRNFHYDISQLESRGRRS